LYHEVTEGSKKKFRSKGKFRRIRAADMAGNYFDDKCA